MTAASPESAPLRRASAGDLPALVELEAVFPSDRISRRAFARLLGRPSAEIWVCAEGAQLLGALVLLFRAGSRSGRIYSIVVRAEARQGGIASRLLLLADERCRQRGCRSIRLEVRARDLQVRDFYRARGYLATAELPDYYEDGAPALRMHKPLP